MNKSFPARLHVVLAREKRVGVVFRRGPSRQVCTFLWNRENDTFQLGQWLKGRIYEKRADLSPDGKYLIYFAMNGKWDSEVKGSWTAISRTPWLKAIKLYAKGDCWEGGGLFLTNKKYWLNDRYFPNDKNKINTNEVQRDEKYIPEGKFGAEDTGVYYRQLLRDGWKLIEFEKGGRFNSVSYFEKTLPRNWILKKMAHEEVGAPEGKGCYWNEYELFNIKSSKVISGSDWEWADLDKSSIVWATGGCLYRAKILNSTEIGEAKLLHDFNPYKFEAINAPY